MDDIKWVTLIVCTLIIALAAGSIVSDLTSPKLTDPVAQRIYAATHGNISLDGKEASKLIKEATVTDSLIQAGPKK